MKNIHKLLKEFIKSGKYYRLVMSPSHIEIKLYSDRQNTDEEINFCVNNDVEGICDLDFSLSKYFYQLKTKP